MCSGNFPEAFPGPLYYPALMESSSSAERYDESSECAKGIHFVCVLRRLKTFIVLMQSFACSTCERDQDLRRLTSEQFFAEWEDVCANRRHLARSSQQKHYSMPRQHRCAWA